MTIPEAARDHLKVGAGDRVKIFLHPDGTVVLIPKQPASSIRGMFSKRVSQPVSLEEMEAAAEEGAAEEFSR